ncbi:hypothetical protein CWC26_21395, partial [Pseudoalteromonas sp. S4488]|uniref:hypothetical protein n=1 Tax=Pseudoalteromonas sp. S4488 TaxID=579558 RepID=UPI0011087A5F
MNTKIGDQQTFNVVKDFALSDDGVWLAYRLDKKAYKKDSEEKDENSSEIKPHKKDKSLDLVLINLQDKNTHTGNNVFR